MGVSAVSGEAGADGSAPVAPRFGPWRRELRAFLELFAVTGMAVARPTLGILTNNASIFVSRQTRPVELVLLVLFLVLVPPLVLWLLEVGIGALLPRARRPTHTGLLAAVAGVFVVAVLKKQTGLGPAVLIVTGVAAGAVAAVLVWRYHAVRLFLRYLAIAPVLFAVLFLTSTSVQSSVFDPDPAAAKVAVNRPHRVVMIVLDELPETSLLDGNGAIDADLFPNFAALAATSTWYRNATTVAPYTGAAVPAILTGRYRSGSTDVAVASNTPHNLFTLLGDTYSMHVKEQVTRLCPAALCDSGSKEPTADRVSDLVDASRELWWENASPERKTVNAFSEGDILGDPTALTTGERFVRDLRPSALPRLDFLHVEFPHQGWHYLPTGQDYLEDTTSPGLYWDYTWGSRWAGDLARQRHLLQVAAADRLVGDVVARLKRIGAYDDTLLVVTADHGVAFGERQPIRGVSKANSPNILWVPMMIKAPHQSQATVDDRPARTIDVLPTVADELGIKMPWPVDGRSLLLPPRRDDTLKVLDWAHNVIKADRHGFIHVPRAPGFAQVLRARDTAATGPVAQRLYQVGPYGDLLGRDASSMAQGPRDEPTVTLDDPARFRAVDPSSRRVPWAYVQGTVNGDLPVDAPLAITVDGVVAGLSGAYLDPLKPDQRSFWTVLDPTAFHPGSNEIGVALIEGTPAAPELVPLRITR